MKTWNAISGQSIYDIVIQTYGSIDYLAKLMQDNNVLGVNDTILSGQSFLWDDTLVQDQNINVAYTYSGIIYATDSANYGNVFYVTTVGGNVVTNPGSTPYLPPVPSTNTYQMVLETSFTSGADGTNVLTPMNAANTSNLIGYDMQLIILENKPLLNSQYVWNKTTGVLTLVGVTVDNGATLFILYSKIGS